MQTENEENSCRQVGALWSGLVTLASLGHVICSRRSCWLSQGINGRSGYGDLAVKHLALAGRSGRRSLRGRCKHPLSSGGRRGLQPRPVRDQILQIFIPAHHRTRLVRRKRPSRWSMHAASTAWRTRVIIQIHRLRVRVYTPHKRCSEAVSRFIIGVTGDRERILLQHSRGHRVGGQVGKAPDCSGAKAEPMRRSRRTHRRTQMIESRGDGSVAALGISSTVTITAGTTAAGSCWDSDWAGYSMQRCSLRCSCCCACCCCC